MWFMKVSEYRNSCFFFVPSGNDSYLEVSSCVGSTSSDLYAAIIFDVYSDSFNVKML